MKKWLYNNKLYINTTINPTIAEAIWSPEIMGTLTDLNLKVMRQS